MMRVVAKMITSGLIVVNKDTSVETRLRSYRILLVNRVLRYKLDLVLVETNIKNKCPQAKSRYYPQLRQHRHYALPQYQDLTTTPTPPDNDDGLFYDSNDGYDVEFDDFLANTNAFTEEVTMRMNRLYANM
jgi:hypothetical protein